MEVVEVREKSLQAERDKNMLQSLIVITHSPKGNRLKRPVKFVLPQAKTPGEKAVQKYVVDSFLLKMSSLISFSFSNTSVINLAKYFLRHTMGSKATLYQYVYGVYRFSNWKGKSPDAMIEECQSSQKAIMDYVKSIDEFIGDLQAEGLAPGTISNYVKSVKTLFRVNGLSLILPYKVNRRVIFKDRSPTPEEITKIIDIGDIRDKVIVSVLALGGFREGTLVRLKYRHIRKDLEKGRVPIHVHVEAEITKGKYQDYDTFLGAEAVEYLRIYINSRIKGSRRLDPETITDESPLIRNEHSNKPKPISETSIYRIVHELYYKTGLVSRKAIGRRHELRPHSIRKFFRTQMAALGVPTDYIEYMMGHTINIYHDVQMKGVEFLRNIYASSGLSIRPQTQWSKIDQVKAFMKSIGLNPEELLVRDAMSKPHRTVIDIEQKEGDQLEILGQALRKAILNVLK